MVRAFLIACLFLVSGCKSWSDMSYGERSLTLIATDIGVDVAVEGAKLAGKGINELSECAVELKDKALSDTHYEGLIECNPISD